MTQRPGGPGPFKLAHFVNSQCFSPENLAGTSFTDSRLLEDEAQRYVIGAENVLEHVGVVAARREAVRDEEVVQAPDHQG